MSATLVRAPLDPARGAADLVALLAVGVILAGALLDLAGLASLPYAEGAAVVVALGAFAFGRVRTAGARSALLVALVGLLLLRVAQAAQVPWLLGGDGTAGALDAATLGALLLAVLAIAGVHARRRDARGD